MKNVQFSENEYESNSGIKPVQYQNIIEHEKENPLATILNFFVDAFTKLTAYKSIHSLMPSYAHTIIDIVNAKNRMTECEGVEYSSQKFLAKEIVINGKSICLYSILQTFKGDKEELYSSDELFIKGHSFLVNTVYLKNDDYSFYMDNVFDSVFNLFSPASLVGASNNKQLLKFMQIMAPFIITIKTAKYASIADMDIYNFVNNKLLDMMGTVGLDLGNPVLSTDDLVAPLFTYEKNYSLEELFDEGGILYLLQNEFKMGDK